jgi:O-antigen/teichoic acid export membrane protein
VRRLFARVLIREDHSLAGRAGRALGWSFVNMLVARLGTFGIGVALARILGPEEFGTYAVAMVALLALLSFSELGVSLAIVRWPGEPREIAPTVMTISAVSGVFVYAACFLGAPAFAAAMGSPESTAVVRLLAVQIMINGLVITPATLMQRHFRQDRRMLADQVNNWLGAFVSIGLAIAGMGAMSLAIGRLAGAGVSGVLFFVYSPEPVRFGFDRKAARSLLSFGLPLAGSGIILFAVTNVDQLVVGSVLGPVALGFYALAVNLSNWPLNVFSMPVRQVVPAALARLQGDPPAMRSAFLSSTGLLGAATLPVCLLLAGAAEPLVRLVYGAAWAPAAGVLTWLGVLAALRILYEVVYDYFITVGRSRVLLVVQVVWLVALIPALYAGARADGISGVAAAHVGVAVGIVLPIYLWELRRVEIGVRAIATRLAVPVLAGTGVWLAALAVQRVVAPDLPALALSGLISLAVVALLMMRMRNTIHRLRTMEVSA